MAANSKIPWCDNSFNPWVGCTKVGPGCDNCYAEAWAKRTGYPELWTGDRRRTKTWKDPVVWNREAARLGIRYKVFCASLADVFDNAVPPDWRADLWALVRATPHLDWIIVTKRVGNVPKMLPDDWGAGYANVCLLITVCTQGEAVRDIPKLLRLPAALRGLSVEPMLERINLDLGRHEGPQDFYRFDLLRWIICGAESGPHRRSFDEDWVRDLRDQCLAVRAGVGGLTGVPLGPAFFYKQRIERGRKVETPELDGRRWIEFPHSPSSGFDPPPKAPKK